MRELNSQRILSTEFFVSLQTTILGLVAAEVAYFAIAVGEVFSEYIQAHSAQVYMWLTCLGTIILLVLYSIFRGLDKEIVKLWRSMRVSIILFFFVGVLLSTSVEGIGFKIYQEYVTKVDVIQLMLLAFLPVLFSFIFVVKELSKKKKGETKTSFFVNDQAIKSDEEDLLDVKDSAVRFAEQVLNNGSSDSLVFGIDSPWGVGKSSFVNLCSNYWMNQNDSHVIVVRFEPLRYKESADLVDAFVNELVNAIQGYIFAPTVQSLFYKYLKVLKGVKTSEFLGVNITLERSAISAQEILDNISHFLSQMDLRIIVVIDDLDRLSWAEVKKVLFAIKRSFMLPNVSYVLCYDTENLSSEGKGKEDAEKVKEFLEKYVNIKTSLYLASNTLAQYVSENTEKALKNNLHIDPRTRANIEGTISWLEKIYKSDGFYLYASLIGDIRKLKRLINTLLSLGVHSTDFNNSDYNKEDLLHLLLLHINFPHIFRMIYNAETDGKSGFFSLKKDILADSEDFKNSERYVDFVKSVKKDERLLLSKLFDAENRGKNRFLRACYNGGGYTGRNLERYLKLIVNQEKQDKLESYQFYVTLKNSFFQGEMLDNIISKKEFSFSKCDFVRSEFWNIVSNSTQEINPVACEDSIKHILNHLPEYSLLEEDDIGAGTRTGLIYSLLKLLDGGAWKTEGSRGSYSNDNEKISVIADWVFGENKHRDEGIISALSQADRGVLGLNDLLLFRLYCSADRGSDLFNLTRAISLHGNPDALIQGSTIEIAKEGMREISQRVFQVFLKRYIEPKVNIFEEIEQLNLQDFAGESYGFVTEQVRSGKLSEEKLQNIVDLGRSRARGFIIYQLGNSLIESGVGCGYYDQEGNEDRKGIAIAINDYLFDVCFNPTIQELNLEYFLDYLLRNFSHSFDEIHEPSYVPKIDAMTKVLHRKKLKKYWQKNKVDILAKGFPDNEKSITTGNYVASYQKHLPSIYNVLDTLLVESDAADDSETAKPEAEA